MQISSDSDYALAQVGRILKSHGLQDGNGYRKTGPFLGEPTVTYIINGKIPNSLRAELEAVEDVTLTDD